MAAVTLQPTSVSVKLVGQEWPVIYHGVLEKATVLDVATVIQTTLHPSVRTVMLVGWVQIVILPAQMVYRLAHFFLLKPMPVIILFFVLIRIFESLS